MDGFSLRAVAVIRAAGQSADLSPIATRTPHVNGSLNRHAVGLADASASATCSNQMLTDGGSPAVFPKRESTKSVKHSVPSIQFARSALVNGSISQSIGNRQIWILTRSQG